MNSLGIRMERWVSLLAVTCCAVLFASCASVPRTVLFQVTKHEKVKSKSLRRLLWENEIKPEENILSTTIIRGDFASYHLVQIRDSEKNHAHEYHDLVVFIQSGTGLMLLDKTSIKVRAGSIIFIPHGMPHYFVNGGTDPAVAIAIFSPDYSGKDIKYRE